MEKKVKKKLKIKTLINQVHQKLGDNLPIKIKIYNLEEGDKVLNLEVIKIFKA
jgi:hypothetical protein